MADLKITIEEKLTLSRVDRGATTTQTISGINNVDNRILSCPSGSTTTIFSLSNNPGAGTFVTSSLKYARVTNTSATPVKLYVASATLAADFLIQTGSSFLLSTSKVSGSHAVNNFTLEDITSVGIDPSGSAATIEYFIATT